MRGQNGETVTYQYIYDIAADEEGQISPINYPSSFITQILFKAITIIMFNLNNLFIKLTSQLIYMELIFIFIVVDFWMTKSINGRQMLGVRWQFGEDQYGVERFKFQTRVNEQYTSTTQSKLFWLVQFGYCIIPIIQLSAIIIIAPNLQRVVFTDFFINLAMLVGGSSNFFFFWKAVSAGDERRNQLKKEFGSDFLRKLGKNSIVSFL